MYLCLARSRNIHIILLGFTTMMDLLHHSAVSSTPRGISISCSCCLSSFCCSHTHKENSVEDGYNSGIETTIHHINEYIENAVNYPIFLINLKGCIVFKRYRKRKIIQFVNYNLKVGSENLYLES